MTQKKENIDKFFEYLARLFPDAECELRFNSGFELLVAVILSAQCTDRQVNKVTDVLFKKYNKPKDFAKMDQKELEKMIYSIGFYHNKAKNIIKMSNQLLDDYNGKLPTDAREMEKLAGVGRKTANVVSSILYNAKEFAVDTHVFRVLNRIGFVHENTPEKTEKAFVKKYPNYVNHQSHLRIVLFGRYNCMARIPKCEKCEMKEVCKFYKESKNEKCF